MDDIDKIRAQWAQQRPDLETGPMGLIGRLGRVARHLSQEMDATFARHGLSPPSFDVLATLLRAGPPHALTPNQLLATMMITSGTMTNRIDQLVRSGMVERIRNGEDKRSVLVGLTPKGRMVIDAAVTDHVATQARLVAVLGAAQRDQLDMGLRHFLAALQQADEGPAGAGSDPAQSTQAARHSS